LSPSASTKKERVQLFHTCLVNEVDPEAGWAVVRVLERLGVDVQVPEAQTCCGQPAYNAGFADDARGVARHALRTLDRTEGPIVIPSGSCGDMIVHQYAELFREEPETLEMARRVSARCQELSQFVASRLEGRGWPGRLAARVAYHPSCHLMRGLGVRDQPVELLRGVEGLELVEVRDAEECCGFGGLFSIKSPEISQAMLQRKLAAIEGSGADRLVSCDLGCLLHLAGGLHRLGSRMKVQHIAETLDEAAE
jgi:L-lactate dehydrogenase complex protein LldE